MNTRIKTKILIIGKNEKPLKDLKKFLENQTFTIKILKEEASCLKEAFTNKYPLIIIHSRNENFILLLEYVKIFRESGNKTPIILILDNPSVEEMIAAYKVGINTFHKKDINYLLLVAQIERLLDNNFLRMEMRVGDIIIQPRQRKLFRKGIEIHLTRSEFNFLILLLSTNGSVLNRNYIISNILSYNRDVSECAVDTMVSRIRKKLGREKDEIIETVQGKGYRLGSSYIEGQEILYR